MGSSLGTYPCPSEIFHSIYSRSRLTKISQHPVKDSFEFCEHVDKFAALKNCSSVHLCSFDVVSLFTNVPLQEVVQVCLNTLYRDEDVAPPTVPEELLKKLLFKAMSEVDFSFDGQLYQQADGVAMGSPLGPILANIFVGHLESSIPKHQFPLLYDRFVDDTFSNFSNSTGVDVFFRKLNSLHPNVQFTMEMEEMMSFLSWMCSLLKSMVACNDQSIINLHSLVCILNGIHLAQQSKRRT